jgi:predicted nuclease of predicted toxin-antitoxin system
LSTPRFLADEDLRHRIVKAARRLEPSLEFVTVVELGLSQAKDPEILEYAGQNNWLLVSHDVNTMKDYAEQRLTAGQSISGLFLVPQNKASRSVAESLVLIWAASSAEEWKDRIVYLPF